MRGAPRLEEGAAATETKLRKRKIFGEITLGAEATRVELWTRSSAPIPMLRAMSASADLASYLERTLATELPNLRAIPDGPGTARPNRPSGVGWSQREELGHLVDSALNNHARIVRAALEPAYEGPGYEQEGWVSVHRYREIPWTELVDVWHAHNRILLPLIAGIPAAKLATPCKVGGSPPVTLGFLIDDYVLHMQHHLDNVLRRVPATKYPRA